MKKYLIIITTLTLILVTFVLLKSNEDTGSSDEYVQSDAKVVEFEDNPAKKISRTKRAASQVDEKVKKPSDDVESSGDEEFQAISDEELERRLEAKEEEFDRLEEAWLENVKELFINELQLSQEQYKDYLNLREGLFNDKIQAFEDMHKQLEAKYGESYTYNPTEEEIKFDKEIQQKYDQVLMKKIGKEAFIKYLELRDRTNEQILEDTAQDDAAMLMEF